MTYAAAGAPGVAGAPGAVLVRTVATRQGDVVLSVADIAGAESAADAANTFAAQGTNRAAANFDLLRVLDAAAAPKTFAWTTSSEVVARALGWVIITGAGIDPTGATDSYAAIQAIINTVAARGGVAWLPPGLYKISAKLTMPGDVSLLGSGTAASVITGALATALLSSPNTAVRIYRWVLKGLGFDNTNRATAGGIGVDLTNVSLSDIDIACSNVELGMKASEAAYYNEVRLKVSGAVRGLDIGGGAVSTNECLWFVRINDVVDGVRLNNATNHTFVKPAVETFTGTGFDIAPTSAVQYTNLFAPRFENVGGVGVGVRNRALAQATIWVGGATVSLANDYINSAAAKELLVLRPGVSSLQTRTEVALLTAAGGGSDTGRVYATGGTTYNRNGADSGYNALDSGAVTSRGQLVVTTGGILNSGLKWVTGTGSPEGVLIGSAGSLYSRTDGGAGTTLYVKESGVSNTGWVGK